MPDGVLDPVQLGVAFLAAFLAAAINSVAGGGTLVSFPVLVWLGLPSIVANATSTIGIWPGSLGSIWGFRRELAKVDRRLLWLTIPCFAGGAAGALLLRATSARVFDALVPFLVLLATGLFAVRGQVQRWLGGKGQQATAGGPARVNLAVAMLPILAVGVYGGYFGAGMSIMMLSTLGVLGLTDILEMNALTSLFALCVNGVAIALFIAAGLVYWPFVAVMAVGSLLGGYGAAGLARRIGKQAVSRFVLVVGFTVSALFFLRRFS